MRGRMGGCPKFIFFIVKHVPDYDRERPIYAGGFPYECKYYLLNYFAFAGIKVLKYSYCTERGKN
jgi:hypothetical protein